MPELQLSFHTTFALKRPEVARLLRTAAETGLNRPKEELMARTGFGNKKIGPVKSWASRAGLVGSEGLSNAGEIAYRHDALLESLTTAWLLHFYLSFGGHGLVTPPEAISEWGGWPYFVFEFRPRHAEFSVDDLVLDSSGLFSDKPALLRDNFSYLLRAYTAAEGLSACRFVQAVDGHRRYRANDPELPNPLLIGYFLACLWERDFPDASSVVTEDFVGRAAFGAVLGLRAPVEVQSVLDQLEGRSIVEQRRTVTPFQLVRRWHSPLDLLERAYRDDQAS